MDIGKILNNLILTYCKREIYRKKSISFNIVRISGSFVSISNPKGMFLFTIYKFFYYITMSQGRGTGSDKLLYKVKKVKPLSTLQSVVDKKGFSFICSS